MGGWFTAVLVIWTPIAAIVGWGSFTFAKRDSRSTSWMKITIAAVALGFFGLIAICSFLLPLDLVMRSAALSEFLVGAILFVFLTIAIIGTPVCVGCIAGILLGIRRER
jgi:polyferredoxin